MKQDTARQEREWLTPAEVQAMLGIGRTKIYSMLGRELRATRIGRAVRVARSDVERYLEENQY